MRILVVGAGTVGTSIAEELASDHEVVVIDSDRDRVDELRYSLDILGIHGDGTVARFLEEAGVETADILIASTDDDRANIISALTAKLLGDVFTIVRVKRFEFLESWRRDRQAFGVDHMICTDLLTAQVITDIIGLPGALTVRSFANGTVQMAEFSIAETSPLVDKTVQEADRFGELTFVAVFRNERIEVVDGGTTFEAGDSVVVIGPPNRVRECSQAAVNGGATAVDRFIVLMGGSTIAYHIAKKLEQRGYVPRIIESDSERADELASELSDTIVMNHDALDIDFLKREKFDRADTAIASLGIDGQNLLSSLLANRLGISRTISITENVEYAPLFESAGVSTSVTPRQVAAEEILRFAWKFEAENLAIIEHDAAEVIEFVVEPASPLANRSIEESMADLPNAVVIGAITRDGRVLLPRGETKIRPNDHVILFVESSILDAILDWL